MNVLVTGGGGFLGRAIVRRLLSRGEHVRMLNRSRYPELEAEGVQAISGDIGDRSTVLEAAKGCDVVIHVAALAGSGLYRPDFRHANVVGTEHVLNACADCGIRSLVYTSSPSVVHASGDIEGSDESLPYPAHYSAPYPATKAEAERKVLAANSASLRTVALRPHLIWGPGDNHLLPRLIDRNRKGRLRLPNPEKCIDTVYIDNAADAHIRALDDLSGPGRSSGKAYFISNGEPRPVAEIMAQLLEAAGETPRIRTIAPPLARAAAASVDFVWRLLRLRSEPPISRFVIEQLATAHWFDISAARRDFGYEPRVSLEDGLKRLATSCGGTIQDSL